MAMESASMLPEGDAISRLEFSYFTAGLGGSGPVNLYITNLGFGEEVEVWCPDPNVGISIVSFEDTRLHDAAPALLR